MTARKITELIGLLNGPGSNVMRFFRGHVRSFQPAVMHPAGVGFCGGKLCQDGISFRETKKKPTHLRRKA